MEYTKNPELVDYAKYRLDKGMYNETEVILLSHGKIFGVVMLPYSNIIGKTIEWEVMLNRLTKIG